MTLSELDLDIAPPMDYAPQHNPCDYFARIGFARVLQLAGGAHEPVQDWSRDGDDDARDRYVAARLADQNRVMQWLCAGKVEPMPGRAGCRIGGLTIRWPDRLPQLTTWAGQQTLPKLAKERQDGLKTLAKRGIGVADLLDATVPLGGVSGLDPIVATRSIDDGFSLDKLGMPRHTRIAAELLAIIGLDALPITVRPDGWYEYDVHLSGRYEFRREVRVKYYGRWTMATLVRPWA